MKVQVNLNSRFEFTRGDRVEPLKYCGDVVVAVDPGKTNMAVVIGTTFDTRLCVLQFSAAGSHYDNSEYCMDFKDFISRYLHGCNVKVFGIEQAISKKGMNYHRSSMVLTQIRANLINLAYELTDGKAIEINNWTWKHSILPDGMRSQSEKGSARFLPNIYDSYGNADVTDAICMYMYLMKTYKDTTLMFPNKIEEPLSKQRIFLVPTGSSITKDARRFRYNNALKLEQNCIYFTNRTWEKGVATVEASALSLEDIYKYASRFPVRNNNTGVEVVVLRL